MDEKNSYRAGQVVFVRSLSAIILAGISIGLLIFWLRGSIGAAYASAPMIGNQREMIMVAPLFIYLLITFFTGRFLWFLPQKHRNRKVETD